LSSIREVLAVRCPTSIAHRGGASDAGFVSNLCSSFIVRLPLLCRRFSFCLNAVFCGFPRGLSGLVDTPHNSIQRFPLPLTAMLQD
jgi:hypothetical protein